MDSAPAKIELYRRDLIALAGDLVRELHPKRSRPSELEPPPEEPVKPEPMSPAA
jgi:hypothetical protein